MSASTRFRLGAILLYVGVAGCAPANYVQRVRAAQECEVRVCRSLGVGSAQCDCTSHDRVSSQVRELWRPQFERP